eukprot:Seg1254.7 transcript_id=Seg1254.7/GoldUCD/mRNA.D3Y31 product="Galanin receptor type 2" protein_id=Seg1254.7/GoldUCD/D3Y31
MDDQQETVYPNISLPHGQMLSLVALNTLISIVNILVNLFLIYAMWKLKLHTTLSQRLILCLNFSDLCVGLAVQPCVTAVYLTEDINKASGIRLTGQFFSFIFCQFSGVMTMIITLDRYLHMKYLHFYKVYMTSRKAVMFIAGNLGLSICLAVTYTLASTYGFFSYVNTAFLIIDLVVLITIFLLYTCTYLSLRSRVKDSQLPNVTAAGRKERRVQRRDAEFAKGMILILAALFACYMPYFITATVISFYKIVGRPMNDTLLSMLYWTYLLVYLNSSCNAFVFILFNRRIRAFAKSIFRRGADENLDSTTMDVSKANIETPMMDISKMSVANTSTQSAAV